LTQINSLYHNLTTYFTFNYLNYFLTATTTKSTINNAVIQCYNYIIDSVLLNISVNVNNCTNTNYCFIRAFFTGVTNFSFLFCNFLINHQIFLKINSEGNIQTGCGIGFITTNYGTLSGYTGSFNVSSGFSGSCLTQLCNSLLNIKSLINTTIYSWKNLFPPFFIIPNLPSNSGNSGNNYSNIFSTNISQPVPSFQCYSIQLSSFSSNLTQNMITNCYNTWSCGFGLFVIE